MTQCRRRRCDRSVYSERELTSGMSATRDRQTETWRVMDRERPQRLQRSDMPLTVMADAAQRETQRRETRAGLGLVSCLVPLRAILEYLRRFLYKRTPALRMGNASRMADPTTPSEL